MNAEPPWLLSNWLELAATAAQEINARDRGGSSGEGRQLNGPGRVRSRDEAQDRTQRRAARDAEHVGVGERVAQKRLETGARCRERRAH